MYAGDTEAYHQYFSDYPSTSSWVYTIYFNGPAANFSVSGTGAADGGWDVTINPATTAALAAGAYRYMERVTKGGEVYTVGNGILEMLPNIATAAAGATQTHEEKTLAVIEAALAGRLTADIQSYQIAGRSVTKIPIRELLQLKSIYASKVAIQHNGGGVGVDYQVNFGLPISGLQGAGKWPWL